MKQTIHWKRHKGYSAVPGIFLYQPYVKIKKRYWVISHVCIVKLGSIYDLQIYSCSYFESSSLQATMVKATEILKDLDYTGVDLDYKVYSIPTVCRTTHPIIGWKKAVIGQEHTPVIVKLRVPKKTFCNLTDYKCRAQKAEILGVYDLDLNPLSDQNTTIYSIYGLQHNFFDETEIHLKYRVGDTLVVDNFDFTNEVCSEGIHFFRSPILAIGYQY